jgi:hypothetical protein
MSILETSLKVYENVSNEDLGIIINPTLKIVFYIPERSWLQ